MKDKTIARIKITRYVYGGKLRYLAEIKYPNGSSVSFNESTINKLLKEMKGKIN